MGPAGLICSLWASQHLAFGSPSVNICWVSGGAVDRLISKQQLMGQVLCQTHFGNQGLVFIFE